MSKKPDPVDVHVGHRMELARQMRGVTQQELGRALGVTFQQVQKYLRGTNRISAGKLYECSRVFDVDIGFFFAEFEGSDDGIKSGMSVAARHAQAAQSLGAIPCGEADIMNDYNRIRDPGVRGAIRALIREVSREPHLLTR